MSEIFSKKDSTENSLDNSHPVKILMEEHNILLKLALELKELSYFLVKSNNIPEKEMEKLKSIIHQFKDSESHYVREENVLFPYLEKHGITQPPMIMWSEHQEIRKIKNQLYNLVENVSHLQKMEFFKELKDLSVKIEALLQSHFLKENNVLFPASLKVITQEEWIEIKNGFAEIGYCCFTPQVKENVEHKEGSSIGTEGIINLPTGNFKIEEFEVIMNTLPVDITFVDKDDIVRYYSESKDRIFVRTKAVIGRKVQNCHPQESLYKVQQILDDFRGRKRDSADFWINHRGKLILIRYFALRDKEGKYLGCLEVTQDITEIKKIEGEKRLLD